MAVKAFADAVRRRTPARNDHREQPRKAGRDGVLIIYPRFSRPGGLAAGMRSAILAFLSLMLLACVGQTAAPHIGQTARPDNRTPLASLPAGETTWAAQDLKLHYRAAMTGDSLNISGFVEFNSNLAKYPLINGFRVYLHFLNSEGVVIDSKLLWATGIQQEVRFVRWTFERQWPLPPDTAAVGFSYRGAASEAGGKGHQAKTGWEVYQTP